MSITELLGFSKKSSQNKLVRRDTLADIIKSSSRQRNSDNKNSFKDRRESSVDSGIKSQNSNKTRQLSIIEIKNDFYKLWNKKDKQENKIIIPTVRKGKICYFFNKFRFKNKNPGVFYLNF